MVDALIFDQSIQCNKCKVILKAEKKLFPFSYSTRSTKMTNFEVVFWSISMITNTQIFEGVLLDSYKIYRLLKRGWV